MPFSQMSSLRPFWSSGQAHPGQSKPVLGVVWFILNIERPARISSRSLVMNLVTDIAAPQPAAGWW